MMPMGKRCKSCAMEKVENIFRTANAEKFLLTRSNNKVHACASLLASDVARLRSIAARRRIET
jgi:phage portal protein BeeE